MKKYVITLLFAVISISSWAYDIEIDGIYYNINNSDNTAEVTHNESCSNSYSGSIVIPYMIITNEVSYSVTSIGAYAFNTCPELTSIEIPNSVISIGASAFYNCSHLNSIEIPNSVTSIGDGAFYKCYNLPIIDNLRYADTYLVEVTSKYDCISVDIKEGTKWIGSNAFMNCSDLTSVEIPNSVKSIGTSAFSGCI